MPKPTVGDILSRKAARTCCHSHGHDDAQRDYDDRSINWARLWERVISSAVNLALTGAGLGLLLLLKETLL